MVIKQEVSIGLQHENCYLVGVMKLGSFQGGFPGGGGGRSKFSASRRATPVILPSRENPARETVEKRYKILIK